jgi:peptidoglycan/LPS O-acetylase OafA/YrhL
MNKSLNLKYRADIDGLRALAILPVVLFHAGLGCSGGYVGVDVFFVISGYLIVSQIHRDLQLDRFSLMAFWARRARRIVPGFLVCVSVVFLISWFFLLPADFRELGQSMISSALGISNLYFLREAGYFAGASEIKPLLHTWSLAVEEQFYLVVAPLAYFLGKSSKIKVVAILVCMFFASFGFSIWQVSQDAEAAFYLLPARAWELLIGANFALLRFHITLRSWISDLLGLVGLLAILVPCVLYTPDTPFPGLAALAPCLGATLIIASGEGNERTLVKRLLSCRVIVFIGLISYSLYLWHWPIFAMSHYLGLFEHFGAAFRCALTVFAFLVAALSWKYVTTAI